MPNGFAEVPVPLLGDAVHHYRALGKPLWKKLLLAAKPLRGTEIIHVNATASGGGVAELLQSQVPLERALGLKSRWFALRPPPEFFVVTKKIHNLLQGRPGQLTEREKALYLSVNKKLSASFPAPLRAGGKVITVIHDPQPLPLIEALPPEAKTLLRLHIDLTTPNPLTLDFLRPYMERYDATVVSSRNYRPALPSLLEKQFKIILPAIDPLSEKNRPMDFAAAQLILEEFSVNCTKPILTQVSRFDPWKDPLGVIRAYYFAKNEIPDLQLVLAGFLAAKDDPEAVSVFEQVKKHAHGDPDIHLFENPRALGTVSNDTFINALYTVSTVVIQKSLREGFGLTITEAMWKEKAVVAGNAEGAKLQITNGATGLLVSSPEEAASAVVRLVRNGALRAKLGRAARRSVLRKFLMPRFVYDNVRLYGALSSAALPNGTANKRHHTHTSS